MVLDFIKKDLYSFDSICLLQILPEHLIDFSKYVNIFIIDADENVKKGEVLLKNISEIKDEFYLHHGIGLFELYEVGVKAGYIKGRWYIIAIGAKDFNFSDGISDELRGKFNEIASKVIEICKSLS